MSIVKRGNVWWIDIRHEGQRIRRSTGITDKRSAQEYHDRVKVELWREANLDEVPAKTWAEAVNRFLDEAEHKSIWHDAAMLKWLTPQIGETRNIDTIDQDMIEELIRRRRAVLTCKKPPKQTSPATVNRHMEILGKVLRRCVEWGWLKAAPPVRKLREPNGRVRFLVKDEADALIKALPDPWAACARFTLATGLRERNCTHLEWARVNIPLRSAWVDAEDVKNDVALSIPLNDDAIEILREQAGKHTRWVFPKADGKPIPKASGATWYAALKTAGLDNFHWHDLRHTWASWHVMGGTPLHALQQLGGWKKIEMVMRYAHLAPSYVAQYAQNAKPPELATVTSVTQSTRKGA
ncbi:MAG: site-specific integrase [Steroidobacteraceae bacterium]|nr:site-specific integrase [Steroidobacteraceae bacterium]